LGQLSQETTDLAQTIDGILERALNATSTNDPYDARMSMNQENQVTKGAEAIEERVIHLLTLQQPVVAGDLRQIVGSLVVAQRLHRAGHGALGIARLAIDINGLSGNEKPPADLLNLGQDARVMLRDAVVAFVRQDQALAQVILEREKQIDSGYSTLRDQLLQALSGTGYQESPDVNYHRRVTFWLWIAHKVERIADHSVVIARRAQQLI
jgi:phosphate transport system protein